MTDEGKQAMLDEMCEKGLNVEELTAEQFLGLLDALSRMYNARIWNCVDASMKYDREWGTLSKIFRRVIRELNAEQKEATT